MEYATVPHVGGLILPPGSPTRTVDGLAQARATDQCSCQGPVDFIVTGSGSVEIDGLPAARQGDHTMHGGVIITGSPTLDIGGPTVGVTLGSVAAGTAACRKLAEGRASGKTNQSFGNCGVESTRQLIGQATGRAPDEIELLGNSIHHGDSGNGSPYENPVLRRTIGIKDPLPPANKVGGTNSVGQRNILNRHGVPSHIEDDPAPPAGGGPPMPGSSPPKEIPRPGISQAVAERRGVITDHDAGILWGDPRYVGARHAVVVTGVEYDENGKQKYVVINDTGTGQCGRKVDAKVFNDSVTPGSSRVVTDNSVWPAP